jgi:hypothetical protein
MFGQIIFWQTFVQLFNRFEISIKFCVRGTLIYFYSRHFFDFMLLVGNFSLNGPNLAQKGQILFFINLASISVFAFSIFFILKK